MHNLLAIRQVGVKSYLPAQKENLHAPDDQAPAMKTSQPSKLWKKWSDIYSEIPFLSDHSLLGVFLRHLKQQSVDKSWMMKVLSYVLQGDAFCGIDCVQIFLGWPSFNSTSQLHRSVQNKHLRNERYKCLYIIGLQCMQSIRKTLYFFLYWMWAWEIFKFILLLRKSTLIKIIYHCSYEVMGWVTKTFLI